MAVTAMRSLASLVTPAMCGLKITFSRLEQLVRRIRRLLVEHVEARAAQLAALSAL